jgi:hypothetical protein
MTATVLVPAQHNTDYDGSIITLSAAGPGTYNSPVVTNEECSGCIVVTDITALTAGSVQTILQGFDLASGKWYNLAAPTAYTTAITNFFTAYPTGTTGAASFNVPLPRLWRIQVIVVTGPATVTVGVNVIK